MVAAVISVDRPALEAPDTAGQQRHVAGAIAALEIAKLVFLAAGKPVGDDQLIAAEDVHREMGRCLESWQRARTAVETPQDERRLHRYRVEAAHGEAEAIALGVARGHHRYAGGEPPERVTEFARVEV